MRARADSCALRLTIFNLPVLRVGSSTLRVLGRCTPKLTTSTHELFTLCSPRRIGEQQQAAGCRRANVDVLLHALILVGAQLWRIGRGDCAA